MKKASEFSDDVLQPFKGLVSKYKLVLFTLLLTMGSTVWLISLHRSGPRWEIAAELGKFVALVLAIHLLDHQLIKREERLLFVKDLRKSVRLELLPLVTLVNETKNALEKSRATLFQAREEEYAAIVETIRRVRETQVGEKRLLLVGLHGESGPRRIKLLHNNPVLERFDNEIKICINSSGADMWYVRELYNIADETRLSMILGRIRQSGQAEGYEVRAYCLRDPIPQFKPLIVGGEDLFLGIDDPTYYRVKAGLHIHGSGFAELAARHFEELWKDPRLFRLRTPVGEDAGEIVRLSQEVSRLNSALSTN
jgi:hypothetical protein